MAKGSPGLGQELGARGLGDGAAHPQAGGAGGRGGGKMLGSVRGLRDIPGDVSWAQGGEVIGARPHNRSVVAQESSRSSHRPRGPGMAHRLPTPLSPGAPFL